MTHLLETTTRTTIDSASLINHVFHKPFTDNLDCDILYVGLTDHCATFVNMPFSFEN